VVHLTERVPVVVWQVGDRAVVADERGAVIAEAFDPKLPRIFVAQGDLPAPGSQLPAGTAQAARYVSDKLGHSLAALQYEPTTGLTAQLDDGRQIVLGDSSRMPLKLSVMDSALKLSTTWTKLDVREPDRPYVQ
jgi:cell division protein FtsQ